MAFATGPPAPPTMPTQEQIVQYLATLGMQVVPAPAAKAAAGRGSPSKGQHRAADKAERNSRSRSRSRSTRRLVRHSSSERGDGGRLLYVDDGKKLSNKYKQLGAAWMTDPEMKPIECTPIAFRRSLVVSCDSERFDKLRIALLEEEAVDLLLYCITHIPPDMLVPSFGTTVKGEIRKMARKAYANCLRQSPSRLTGLSAEFDNCATIALRCGLPLQSLSPGLRQICSAMRVGRSIALGGFGDQSPMPVTANSGSAASACGVGAVDIASPAMSPPSKRSRLALENVAVVDAAQAAAHLEAAKLEQERRELKLQQQAFNQMVEEQQRAAIEKKKQEDAQRKQAENAKKQKETEEKQRQAIHGGRRDEGMTPDVMRQFMEGMKPEVMKQLMEGMTAIKSGVATSSGGAAAVPPPGVAASTGEEVPVVALDSSAAAVAASSIAQKRHGDSSEGDSQPCTSTAPEASHESSKETAPVAAPLAGGPPADAAPEKPDATAGEVAPKCGWDVPPLDLAALLKEVKTDKKKKAPKAKARKRSDFSSKDTAEGKNDDEGAAEGKNDGGDEAKSDLNEDEDEDEDEDESDGDETENLQRFFA